MPGAEGESVDAVATRGLAALRDIGLLRGGLPERACPRYVLIAAHGRFNKCLIAALTGDLSKCNEIAQSNTCVNVLDITEDGSCVLQALNRVDHISPLSNMAPSTAAT